MAEQTCLILPVPPLPQMNPAPPGRRFIEQALVPHVVHESLSSPCPDISVPPHKRWPRGCFSVPELTHQFPKVRQAFRQVYFTLHATGVERSSCQQALLTAPEMWGRTFGWPFPSQTTQHGFGMLVTDHLPSIMMPGLSLSNRKWKQQSTASPWMAGSSIKASLAGPASCLEETQQI